MKGIIVDVKDSIAIGFVSYDISIAILDEVKNEMDKINNI